MLQTYLLTLLAPLIGGGNFFVGSKRESGHFFSKDYTTVVKGLCCLIVIYVHVHEPYTNAVQDAIGSFAYVCVTFFFLVSAYGMMLGAERANYLRHFWRNRLVSLLIPALLVNVVVFALGIVNQNSYRFSTLYHLNDYVSVLLQWCLWFYVVMWCKKRWFQNNRLLTDGLLIGGVLVSSLWLYFFVDTRYSALSGWCFERMGLVWGILLFRYYNDFVAWMDRHRLVKTVLLTIAGLILGVCYLKYKMVYFWGAYLLKVVLGAVLLCLLFTATSSRIYGNKVSLWMGNISYEVYLSHGIVMGALSFWLPETIDSGLFILLTVLSTLVLSTVLHTIGKPLVKVLRT